jgi:hypothetical protein
MNFVNPLIFAAGLAAIAIPIAIHLLMRRRRKPTPWAAMRFLAEAMRKRKRRLQLERLLLLAVRCLLVAAIALALGRPTVRGLTGESPFGATAVTLAIVIDDSIASGAADGDGSASGASAASALDRHRAMAVELLGTLRPERGDRAMLIPLSAPLAGQDDLPEASALEPTSDLAALSEFLEALSPTDAAPDLPGALALVGERLAAGARDQEAAGRWVVAVLADGVAGVFPDAPAQAGGAGAEAIGQGPRVSVLVSDPALAGRGPGGDVGIAGLTPVRPVLVVGQGEAVAVGAPARVTVGRSGAGLDGPAAVPVRLRFVDDNGAGPWSEATARLRPGERSASVVLDAAVGGRPRGLAYLEAQVVPQAGTPGVPGSQSGVPGGQSGVPGNQSDVPGNDAAVAAVALRRQLTVAIIDAADPLGGAAGGLDPDDPAAWLRVALAPEAMGEADPLADIAAVGLDPSVVDAPRLARVDAAFVLAPGQLRAGGWRALADFARGGGLVAVFPDPGSALAPWAEALNEAFALALTIGPEAQAHEPPLPVALAPGDDPLGLLGLVEGELEALLRPVTVARSLPLAAGPGEGAPARLLTLGQDRPAALVARPGGEGGRGLLVVFAMPLAASWTDLPARPAVVPIVQELARAGVGLAVGSRQSVAGQRVGVPIAAVQVRPAWSVAAGGSIAPVAVGDEGVSLRPLRHAGPWLALDGAGRAVGLLAVGPDHRGAAREPVERPRVREAVARGLGVDLSREDALVWLSPARAGATPGEAARSPTEAMAASEPALALGAILLAAALALAALEAVLARLFSHAQVAEARRAGVGSGREAA